MAAEIESHSVPHGLRRKLIPLVTLVLLGATIGTFWSLPADSFDRGMRWTFSFLACVLASVVIAIWFFMFAGVARRTRISVALVLALLAAGAMASVRRVEFSGDMEPTFDFRWQESRESRLEKFLAAEMRDPLPIEEEAARPMPRIARRFAAVSWSELGWHRRRPGPRTKLGRAAPQMSLAACLWKWLRIVRRSW